jgi:VIT family
VEGSRQYHQIKTTSSRSSTEEAHQSEGGFMKPIIFGGLDGILTSFAIVAGSAGGNLSPSVVLILGFSNIFADALSMGTLYHLFSFVFSIFYSFGSSFSFFSHVLLSFISMYTMASIIRCRRIFIQQGGE